MKTKSKLSRVLSNEEVSEILDLKQYYSSRYIAGLYNVSKSTINNLVNRSDEFTEIKQRLANISNYGTEYHPDEVAFVSSETLRKKQPRLLYLDVESAPDLAVSFKRFKANMSQDNIIKDGGWLLSVAWAWNEGEVQGVRLTSEQAQLGDDCFLVQLLHDLIEQADIVIAQNGDRFDLPLIKSRCVINSLPPFKKVKTVDTLKIAKSMKFQSNRLDSLGVVLGVGRKIQHQGIKLWVDCMQGDNQALDSMLEYNIQDVELLRDVYHKLKAWNNQAPNAALFVDSDQAVCRVCGSENVEATANQIQAGSSNYTEIICNDCGGRSRLRQPNTTKEKRKNMLA